MTMHWGAPRRLANANAADVNTVRRMSVAIAAMMGAMSVPLSAASGQDALDIDDSLTELDFSEFERRETRAQRDAGPIGETEIDPFFPQLLASTVGRAVGAKPDEPFWTTRVLRGELGITGQTNPSATDNGDPDVNVTPSFLALAQHNSEVISATALASFVYDDFLNDKGSDGSAAITRFTIARDLGQHYEASASVGAQFAYAGAYEDWASTQFPIAIGLTRSLGDNNFLSLDLQERFYNPTRNQQSSAALTFERRQQIGKWALSVKPQVSYVYFGHLPDGAQREDTRFSVGATVARSLGESGVNFVLGARFSGRDSTDPLRDFENVSLPLTFRFSKTH